MFFAYVVLYHHRPGKLNQILLLVLVQGRFVRATVRSAEAECKHRRACSLPPKRAQPWFTIHFPSVSLPNDLYSFWMK